MTRITKFRKKSHLPATGFNASPLLPKSMALNQLLPLMNIAATIKIPTSTTISPSSSSSSPSSLELSKSDSFSKQSNLISSLSHPSPPLTPCTRPILSPIKSSLSPDLKSNGLLSSPPTLQKKSAKHRFKKSLNSKEVDDSRETVSHRRSQTSNGTSLDRKRKFAHLDSRRERRIKARERDMICFQCRDKGHSVARCPGVSSQTPHPDSNLEDGIVRSPSGNESVSRGGGSMGTGNCYKCGKSGHSVKACLVKVDSSKP